MNDPSPVCIFAYVRPISLSACLTALANNRGAKLTPVTIYIDGPKNEHDAAGVTATVKVANAYHTGFFKSLAIIASTSNKGLATSVIQGVTETLKSTGRVIVLEDDLVPTANFLEYMNQSLMHYAGDARVGSISGFSYLVKPDAVFDNYFHPRPTSWGWATWSDRWNQAVWNLANERDLDTFNFKRKFNQGGEDLFRMLKAYRHGLIDTWAIRWAYTHHKYGWLAAYPTRSLIDNRGFEGIGTHCSGKTPPPTEMDDGAQAVFNLRQDVVETYQITKQVNWYSSNLYKILSRSKLLRKY